LKPSKSKGDVAFVPRYIVSTRSSTFNTIEYQREVLQSCQNIDIIAEKGLLFVVYSHRILQQNSIMNMNMNMSPAFGLDAVNVALLPTENAKGKKPLPLVITPRWDCSKHFLVNWCRENRVWLDSMLLSYGAILIRGFMLDTPADMQETIQAFHNNLNNTYRGTSPRRLMEGTDYVFSAAEVPVNYPIAQHIEMSFLDAPPRQLFFGCIKQSDAVGGETALADFRQVYRDLDIDLKTKFLDKGIRYQVSTAEL
jgi:hypothetical protein